MNIKGYTLLEVSLFLAISGALTLVAIVTLGPRLNNVRFTSNMRGLRDNITKEFINAEGGSSRASSDTTCFASGGSIIISSGSASNVAGSREDCVLVGKLATTANDGVRYRSIVALREPLACSQTDSDSLAFIQDCNLARVISQGESRYGYPGGLIMQTGERSFGYVRSPNGNVVSRFSFTGGSDEMQLGDTSLNYSPAGTNEIPVCFEQGSRRAQLVFSLQSSEIDLLFNEGCNP